MFDIHQLPLNWFLDPAAMALDPNYSGDWQYPIDWENVDFEQPQPLEPWVIEIMEEFVDLVSRDPNVAPLLEWYSELPAPGDLLTTVVTVEIAEGMTESMESGYYDDWIFEAEISYLYHTVDWNRFFDEYSSIF